VIHFEHRTHLVQLRFNCVPMVLRLLAGWRHIFPVAQSHQ
jgi:hypothetical protein